MLFESLINTNIHKKTFLILFLTPLLWSFTPSTTGIHNINWIIKTRQISGSDPISHLDFPGAFYTDSIPFLPHFLTFEKDIIPGNNYRIELVDPTFTAIVGPEINAIKNIQITSQINIHSQILIQRKRSLLEISFVPLRKNPINGKIEKLTQFQLKLIPIPGQKTKSIKSQPTTRQSVLSQGKWIKIAIDSSAVYKITYKELIDMGITRPQDVKIFGYGGMLPKMNQVSHYDDLPEIPVWFQKGNDNIFNKGDALLFYAQGPQKWSWDEASKSFTHQNHDYSNRSYYFLSCDQGNVTPFPTEEEYHNTPNNYTDQFDDYRFVDKDQENLIKSGRLWVGQRFDINTTYPLTFNFPNRISSAPLIITSHLLARSPTQTKFEIKNQNQLLKQITCNAVNVGSYTSQYASESTTQFSISKPLGDKFTLTLEYLKSSPSAKGWLDYLWVQTRRKLIMMGNQMSFRDINTIGTNNFTQFHITNVHPSVLIWDVTNIHKTKNINIAQTGASATFTIPTTQIREFVAIDPNGTLPSPEVLGEIPNQNLHGLSPSDLIIVCPQDLISPATQLANFHRNKDKLSVSLITPQTIFNEFSSGSPDVGAIRNFLKMLYDRAPSQAQIPSYLLLFGDGSYNNKEENSNLILTYQSQNSLNPTQSFVTDDFYGLLDDEEGEAIGALDIGIGRFPVKTRDQAQTVVNKIISYNNSNNLSSWRTRICFIGDDEDNNSHMRDADKLAKMVEENTTQYQVQRIFLDAYTQMTTSAGETYPDVNRKITESIHKGNLILNYTGHGNASGLAHERVITVDDILSWQNKKQLPLFMTATCEFSRFDDPLKTSAGELILLHKEGGGVGLFTTTRLVFSSPNFILNQKFYENVFSLDPQGSHYKLGDIMRLTKIASGSSLNKRNFTLLGDPALTLNYPVNTVRTLTLNNKSILQPTDTLKALSKITITGQVENTQGIAMNNFQGILYSTVYDKKIERSTRGNDESPFSFSEQNNILFQGKASIKDGQFTFTFMVPKDINYSFGRGKISYYASSSTSDGAGSTNSLTVGGSNNAQITDHQGPQIDLYMNDEQFASGGITDTNPILMAIVQDSSGINTIGTGIGHDLMAILDRKENQPITLNDHYESELDNYQKGRINYQLTNLTKGDHHLLVKVWDNVNNSSQEELDFVVAEDAKFALKHVLNYPNPFTTNTGFYFEHNMPNQSLEVIIQILTISGHLAKTIETTISSDGYRVGPIEWNGRDDFGNSIGRGVYLYKLSVKNQEGKVATKFQKLVLLK